MNKVILHHSIYDPGHLPANGTFNWDAITHLIMFGSFLRDNAGISYLQFNNTGGAAYLNKLIAEAHAKGVKVLMCVAGDVYTGFFAATTSQAHCTEVVNAIMTTYYDPFKFDGVDLDWEGSIPADKWMMLSQTFRDALDARSPKGLLMADIGRGPSSSQPVDFINKVYDNVQPMIYDNNGWYSWKTGFHNALGDPLLDYPTLPRSDYNYVNGTAYGKQAVERFIAAGLDKNKLTPGLSFYSHLFYNNNPALYAPNQNVYYNDAGGNNTGANPWPPRVGHPADFISAIYPRILRGHEQHYEPNAAMAWMGSQSENFYIAYQTAQSYAAWIAFAEQMGLGGLMLFAQEHQNFPTAIEWPIGSGKMTNTPLLDDFRKSLTPQGPSAPVFTTQPKSQAVFIGSSVTLGVGVSGFPTPSLQWFRNAQILPGATSTSLKLENVQSADEYHCEATNTQGKATSDVAKITVKEVVVADPLSDDFSNETRFNAQWTITDPSRTSLVGQGTGDAHLRFKLDGTRTDLWIDNKLAPQVLQNIANGDFEVVAKFMTLPSELYSGQGIVVKESDSKFILFLFSHQAGGLNIFSGVINGSGQESMEGKPVAISGQAWLKVKRTGDTWECSYSTDGIAYTTTRTLDKVLDTKQIGVYAFNGMNNGVVPAYTAEVDYFFNTSKPIEDEDPIGTVAIPIIVKQPQPASGIVGGVASFTIEAVSGTPMTFQWYKNKGIVGGPVPGAENATYTTVPLTEADNNAEIYCVVKNDGGEVTSETVMLAVKAESECGCKELEDRVAQLEEKIITLDGRIAALEDTGSPVKVNINTATMQELENLPVIGTATANKIIAGRTWANIDDLLTKKVVSADGLQRLRNLITV